MPATFLFSILTLLLRLNSASGRGARVREASGLAPYGTGPVHGYSTAGDRALKEQRGAESCEEVDSARFARCSPRHGCHSEYCGPIHPQQEQWPDLQLFLRTTGKFEENATNILLRSLTLFWPLEHLSLVVVLDAEKSGDVAWKPILEEQLAATGMARAEVFLEPPSRLYDGGHSRQQWSMFWADNYTTSTYIGFVDTDTLFTTVVHPRALFSGGRPIVFGNVGKRTSEFWAKAGRTTGAVLRKPEVMCAMNYFPVIFKASHLVELRAHITALSGDAHFDVAFARFSKTYDLAKTYQRGWKLENESYSQFNIMANYMFYHKPCEYSFSFEELLPGWREYHEQEGLTTCLDSILDELNTLPRAKVAEHWFHGVFNMTSADQAKHLIEGYCRSGGTADVGCQVFHPNTLQESLFRFEEHSWSWNPLCRLAQKRHYRAVKEYGHRWPENVEELLMVDKVDIATLR